MHVFRGLIAQRHVALLVCALALLLKIVVPTGYMIAGDHGRLAIVLCPGTVAMPTMDRDAMAGMTEMAGMHAMHVDTPAAGTGHDTPAKHGQAEMPCAFAGLAAATLAAIDPAQIAAPIAFILAIAIVARPLPWRAAAPFLRPPLRGPPAYP